MLFEGPHIPRSCDPDWGMRDDNGRLKPEYDTVYWRMKIDQALRELNGVEEVKKEEPPPIRGLRKDIVMYDDYYEDGLTEKQKQLIKEGFGHGKRKNGI